MIIDVTCPECKHDFKWEHGLPSEVQLKTLHQFRDFLSEQAKKVYDTKLKSTAFEVFACAKCKTDWQLKTEAISDSAHCEHREAVTLRVELVQFLGAPVSFGMAELATSPDAKALVEHRITQRLRVMAHVFNRGVEEGWIAFGVLADAFDMRLSAVDPVERHLVCVYPGTRLPINLDGKNPVEWLNHQVGFNLFTQEGELGAETEWNRYMHANNLA